jgi:DNA-binding NarL/FixJ family response regulator
VSRAEATPEDLHALANLAEPWNIREDHDPARDQADARAEVAALIRAAMLSRAEAEVISMIVRGVTVMGIARARGVTHQAVRLALDLAIRKMGAPPPPTPAPRVMLSTLSQKKSSARARA